MRLVIPTFLCLVLFGCGDERQCDLVKRHDYGSPDGEHIAAVFEMCCYDTTGYYPQVSVIRAREKLGKLGNVLSGGPDDVFSARWTAPHSLTVEYRPAGEWVSYPSTTTNIDGVTVTFEKR